MNLLKNKKLFYLVILIYTILEILLIINNNGIWADELYTMRVVDSNIPDAINYVLKDVHPPLYYMLLKPYVDFFTFFGSNRIVIAKSFSIIPFVSMLIWSNKVISKRYGDEVAWIYLLLVFGTRVIMYAIEIRMYSLAMLFVTMAYLYANEIRYDNSLRNWILFTVCSILGAYTHYYAVICLSLVYFYLLYFCYKNKCIKKWIICFAVTCISYIPWLIILADQLTRVNEGWGANLSIIDIIMFAIFPFYTNELVSSGLIALICVVIVFLTFNIKKNKDKSFMILSQWNPVYVGIIGIIIALITKKFFTGKYMLPGWGIFWLGISLAIYNNKYKKVFLSLLIVLNIFTYVVSYQKEDMDRRSYYELLDIYNENDMIYISNGMFEIVDYYCLDLNKFRSIDDYSNDDAKYLIVFDRDNFDNENIKEVKKMMFGGTNATLYEVKR